MRGDDAAAGTMPLPNALAMRHGLPGTHCSGKMRMKFFAGSGALAALGFAVALAGCSTRLGGFMEPEPASPTVQQGGPAVAPGTAVGPALAPPVNVSLPATTADGTQQFLVPPAGRGVMRDALVQRLREPISDARVSNAWRTAAGAQNNPNAYAACIETTSPAGSHYFMFVVNGSKTDDVVAGPAGQQKCTDPNRVVRWLPFPEATKVE